MTTATDVLTDELDRMVATLVRTAEAGRDACIMVAAYGNGRRRWTAFMSAEPDLDAWPLASWLCRSGTDAVVVGMDVVARVLDYDEVAAYVSTTRPREDPAAVEEVLALVFARVGTEARCLGGVARPYGRDDDGHVRWGDATALSTPPTGDLAGAIVAGLSVKGDNQAEQVVAEMVAAGCAVLTPKGRWYR